MTGHFIRQRAKEVLRGNWLPMVMIFLVFYLFSLLDYRYKSIWLTTLIMVASFVYYYGVSVFSLHLVRERKLDYNLLISGFSILPKIIMTNFLRYLYVLLLSLLFLIPGVVAAYSYSMTEFVILDNPDLKSDEILTTSAKIMKGNKWRLFMLDLSFIGWILLCFLTMGIGFLWLAPYMQVARTTFYQDLKMCTKNDESDFCINLKNEKWLDNNETIVNKLD
ncbi:MAG: DUF975 family protein [Candidatus Cloacimonetes bacterium]|nr:DUF975 family protein [Candidatus Cloacimonadota bacterium]